MVLSRKPTAATGPVNGRLASCSSQPNCVSSFATDPAHYVSPIAFSDSPQAAFERLRGVIAAMPGARIVRHTDDYLHAEFMSRMFGFVDDLECLVDTVDRRIDIRSASRVGYYDFGVNRKRVEEIRARLTRQGRGGLDALFGKRS